MPRRYYEIHPGKNRFCCGGRIIQGKDLEFFATIALILIPTVLFTIFE